MEPKLSVLMRVEPPYKVAHWRFVIQGPGFDVTEMMSREVYANKWQALKAAKKWREKNGLTWKIHYHRYGKLVAV